MTISVQLTNVLAALGRRISDGSKHDLTPAIPVLGDLSRIVMSGRTRDIKEAQSAVAKLREQIDVGAFPGFPAQALRREYGHVYLAGAMWAVNEMMTTKLDLIEHAASAPSRTTRKGLVEDLVLRLMSTGAATSPKTVLDSEEGRGAELRKDEVSKALSTLLGKGWIAAVEPGRNDDRRQRYYALSELGSAEMAAASRQGPRTTLTTDQASSPRSHDVREDATTRS